ncbi:MAG: tRNA pseudouridine(55) synthase TruB [Candidatus Cloacimonetes bacterium]|nr:tRNA pseudouridine(55) synthase TruB [Candidatus Cloacimonadota bacterium]
MNFFLLIDKDEGSSSFNLIRQLRKLTGIKKIGHGGTLDPFATGLMICAGGQYTRLLRYAEAKDKTYEACIKLGYFSDTGDPEGEIKQGKLSEISVETIAELPMRVLGERELKLPRHSAIKIDGKRAYKYAREGSVLEMPTRLSQIHDFEILKQEENCLHYCARVSKGTYIRSLSEYIAELLGCDGYTLNLRRTMIGKHSVNEAHKMNQLGEDWREKTIDPAGIISHLPALKIDDEQVQDIFCGRKISFQEQFQNISGGLPEQEYALFDEASALIAIGKASEGLIYPQLVFNRENRA